MWTVLLLCQAVSSRQLPLCCVVCNGKIQRVKNNNSSQQLELAPGLARERLPSSVSGYSLAKSVSNYSIKSGSLDFDTQHGATCEGKCHTFIRVKKLTLDKKTDFLIGRQQYHFKSSNIYTIDVTTLKFFLCHSCEELSRTIKYDI